MRRGLSQIHAFTLLACAGLTAGPGCQGRRLAAASGDFRPIYTLDAAGGPVRFRAARGRGSLTLSFDVRPPLRFLSLPLFTAEKGELIRLASTDSWLNLGYVPPQEAREEIQHWVTLDWVVFGPDGYRESGVTRVLLEISPERGLRVLHAENDLDSRRPVTTGD